MRKEDKYRELIRLQEDSGLSVRQFCFNQCIAPATYYYWRKKFTGQQQTNGFIPLLVESPRSVSPDAGIRKPGAQSFHSKQTVASVESVELIYPNGVILRLGNPVDISDLKTLINLGG